MSKLLRIWKACNTACDAVSDCTADCEKATARTKRDGGVKSPGRPRSPEPCPNCANVMPPSLSILSVGSITTDLPLLSCTTKCTGGTCLMASSTTGTSTTLLKLAFTSSTLAKLPRSQLAYSCGAMARAALSLVASG